MNSTLVIAEAGVNHNGSVSLAKELVDAAVDAGVDYVKFQTFKAGKLASKNAGKAAYQLRNTTKVESQQEMLKKLELDENAHLELIEYCNQKGIKFLSTPFDLDSIVLLRKLGVRLGKIPSGEITNLPYLRKMAENFEELIVSTGMTEMNELEDAFRVIVGKGVPEEKITILHCNTEYPTPFQDVNLRAMETIRQKFNVRVGYSDHTLGIEVPIAAVALGASVIEKHFTLDKTMEGPDHKASLDPHELKEMMKAIRHVEMALGSNDKKVTNSEARNKVIARKSIVAAKNIRAGELFTEDNLDVKRPGNGISPMLWDQILGKKSKRDFMEDDLIEL